MKRTIWAGLVAILAAGCGSARVDALAAQVAEIQKQLVDLRKNQAGQQVFLETMETDLFVIKDEVETARTARYGTRGMPDLPTVRVQPQHGPEAVFDPSADQLTAAAPARRGDPGEVTFDRLDDGGNLVRGGSPAAGAAPAAPPAPAPRPTRLTVTQDDRDAAQLYKDSYDLVQKKKYPEAISGLEAFIRKYPTHSYADNALYWMGEAYYDRGLWRKALETFQSVIQNYPLGNKAPDAMLKLGLCHWQLRNTPQAREVLHQVAEIYPNSPVAKIAMSKLELLQ